MHLTTYDIECLTKIKALIYADLGRHYTIQQLAAVSGMGETKLKKCFKQHYQMGIFEYLQQQRMQLAIRLLQDTDCSIKTIARNCGYRYYSNFSAAFKAYHGLRPATYRNANR